MLSCLVVHVFAFAGSVTLLAGWEWAPLGVAAGIAFAVYDELDERRRLRGDARAEA